LHRWHHSVKIKESNKNFGNNLIVWDLLFGTWHLPKAKNVERLGLINRNYPLGLIDQLKSPFINGLDQEEND
jgi:sterol desaturase/sphingolipid hydroxylase (fatty acid hydroxylase superfamily)